MTFKRGRNNETHNLLLKEHLYPYGGIIINDLQALQRCF